jgi:hypothetical protein
MADMDMESADGIINSLEIKVKQLANLYVKAKEERDLLINQSVAQEKTIEEQNIEIEKLRTQVRTLENDKQTKPDAEMAKVKDRIGDLMREIDRCIELLNK